VLLRLEWLPAFHAKFRRHAKVVLRAGVAKAEVGPRVVSGELYRCCYSWSPGVLRRVHVRWRAIPVYPPSQVTCTRFNTK
jgi:hypothetical protein